MKTRELRCADILIKILEAEGVEFIFGHPGEQILPLYDAMRTSKIKHVLMRHEQGAAHAADGYARSLGKFGVCISTAGPGAMNLVMGIATAYKDSVPLLVMTGDVPQDLKGKNTFQDVDICDVLRPITIETFDVKNAKEAVFKLKKALKMLKYGKTGPVHLNLPKDVLLETVSTSVLEDIDEGAFCTRSVTRTPDLPPKIDDNDVSRALELLEGSKRPLILVGAGVLWAGAQESLKHLVENHRIPLVTTYPARGVLPEDHPLCLRMLGLRGTDAANFAGGNCDVLLALGCRFSERTIRGIGNCRIIHVNLDEHVLEGDISIGGDVSDFINKLGDMIKSRGKFESTEKWIRKIQEHSRSYNVKTDYLDLPMKPQRAIKEIIDASEDSLLINDAGTHTTWVTLLKTVKEPASLIFSGGFGPMGYGVPASVGAALANPDKSIVVVVGDGGFQMTLQELATIANLNLPVVVCIINNSSLGIIKQWQDLYYGGRYAVELENPDFVKLAEAYNIDAVKVDSPGTVFKSVKKALKTREPYLIEVVVDKDEGITLPGDN